MKISYHWLKQYISIEESPEELAEILTSTGLEVESIIPHEAVTGSLTGLVIGEVLTCKKHPNADKLSLTTVDIGGEIPLHIVCGAPNVATGQKVIVAKPGTTLYPYGREPFIIREAKIRGEKSEGMICAEDEIGLSENHSGIIVLQTSLANGSPAAAHYAIEKDFVFEIGLTPNRADAASHIGVARDVKAFKNGALQWPNVDHFKVDHTRLTIPVEVENTKACLRYSAITLSGIQVAESPGWLKNRLRAIGLAPINNIVDITNFVCHELGQPLHAFDADQIKGGKVIVKTLKEGTLFKTLDNKERTLSSEDLMICNAAEGMCIAGVFGGIQSGITSNTKNIFLESACFSPAYIRKTGLRHQLKTDASFRFERGTHPTITVYALKRAALLIKEIAGGQISAEVVDIYPNKAEERLVMVKFKNVDRLIGLSIPRDRIFSILESLDFRIINKESDQFKVAVPPYRVEVLQEADVIEEILRIYGFNNVPLSSQAGTSYLADFPTQDIHLYKRSIGEMLAANGYYEILTNSLTHAAYQQKHKLSFTGEPVEILNKLSEEQGMLRQTMLFTGLEVCAHNINRKQKNIKLFEFGKIYWKDRRGYQEEERLALYLGGENETENWQRAPQKATYYDLAQQVAAVLNKSNLPLEQKKQNDALFDYGTSIVNNGKIIGRMGKVKSALLKDFGIKQEIFYADLDTFLLFQLSNPMLVMEEVPRYPEVRRDLSLVLDKKITFAEIKNLVWATEQKLIKELIAFDVYQGEHIPEGKKAYALGFILLDKLKTLTDEEIDQTMNKLIKVFEEKMGALIRK